MFMQEMYHCFKKSNSINEFKDRVFKNRIRTPYSYAGPLKELLMDSFERSEEADLLCNIFAYPHSGLDEAKSILEHEIEKYYAETLAEYYPKFEDYLYDELNEEKLAA